MSTTCTEKHHESQDGLPEKHCLSREEFAQLWNSDEVPMSDEQSDLLPKVKDWLSRRSDDLLASYLSGKPVAEAAFSQESLRNMTAALIMHFRPMTVAISVIKLIAKVIDRGNAKGIINLCPPNVPVLLPAPLNPFRQNRWHTLDVAEMLRNTLQNEILSTKFVFEDASQQRADACVETGRMFLSSIVHGGLIHPSCLEALAERLFESSTALDCLGQRVFVELSLGWKGQKDAEFRRWFPDPLTSLLIMQLSEKRMRLALQPENSVRNTVLRSAIWRCIKAYLRYAGVKASVFPNSLTRLLDAVKMDFETRLPIVLANYASRNIVSHSLKPEVWRRLHGLAAKPNQGKNHSAYHFGVIADEADLSEVDPRWMSDLRHAMRGDNRAVIIERLDKLIDADPSSEVMSDSGKLITRFARYLFSYSDEHKKKLAPTTARNYAIVAARRIGGLLDINRLKEYWAEEWRGIFEEVLADANDMRERRRLVIVLRKFQHYLEHEHNISGVDTSGLFGTSNGLVPVDANIILEDEFLRIRNRFNSDLADREGQDLAEAGWLILTLAYRCGLRRMEALMLEVDDVLISAPATLLVRPTEARRLKTKSSTRKIPLYALLNHEELIRLEKWLFKRKTAESLEKYSRFLFAVPHRNFVFPPQDTMLDLLHRVMREATCDETLRFHHLRHSFASRICVMLAVRSSDEQESMVASLPGIKQAFTQLAIDIAGLDSLEDVHKYFPGELASKIAGLPGIGKVFESSLNERGSLLQEMDGFQDVLKEGGIRHKLYGNNHMTRKDAFAICSLLGHSGPDVSAEHYIHFLDICLAEKLSHPDISPSIDVLAKVGEQTKGNIRRYGNSVKMSMMAWVVSRWQQKHAQAHKANIENSLTVSDQGVTDIKGATALASMELTWKLIHIHETMGRSPRELMERYGVEQSLIERNIANAQWLSSLRMHRQGKHQRHSFVSWVPDKRYPSMKIATSCPTRLHIHADRRIYENIAPKLDAVFQDDPSFVMRVLEDFAANARRDFPGVIFADPEKPEAARDFLELLRRLGLKNKEIQFVTYDKLSIRSKVTGRWRTQLKLGSDANFEKRKPLSGTKDRICNWIGIMPLLRDDADEFESSPAFKFAMIMMLLRERQPHHDHVAS